MTFYIGGDGTFDQVFMTEYEIIDRYVGGQLWMCGYNTKGNLGDNSTAHKSSPVQTVAGGTNWKFVTASQFATTTGVKTDGTLWVWGDNSYGQLGDNTTAHKSSPVQTVAGGTNWKTCSLGNEHIVAVKTDGTLWCWGGNTTGALGDNTTAHKSSPVQTVAGGNNWKQVAASAEETSGLGNSFAIKTDGTLWCWGGNTYGQLGDNTTAHKSSPIQTVAGGTNWKQVAAGRETFSAVKTDGTLWLCGLNTNGQIGDNTTSNRSSPVQTVAGGANWKYTDVGYSELLGIKTDGTLWMWGLNSAGQLGDNTTTHKSSPVQTVAGGTNWKIAAVFQDVSGIKTDGTLWRWGANSFGQLGDGTTVNKSSPVQTVAGGTNWKTIGKQNTGMAAITFTDMS